SVRNSARLEIVLAELLDERRAAQLQQARRVRDGAVGLLERRADQMFLDRAQVLAQVEPVARDERLREALSVPAFPDRRRQVLPLDTAATAQDRQALDEILELAHVARPLISAHARERDVAELDQRPPFGHTALHEIRDQRGQIFDSL